MKEHRLFGCQPAEAKRWLKRIEGELTLADEQSRRFAPAADLCRTLLTNRRPGGQAKLLALIMGRKFSPGASAGLSPALWRSPLKSRQWLFFSVFEAQGRYRRQVAPKPVCSLEEYAICLIAGRFQRLREPRFLLRRLIRRQGDHGGRKPQHPRRTTVRESEAPTRSLWRR